MTTAMEGNTTTEATVEVIPIGSPDEIDLLEPYDREFETVKLIVYNDIGVYQVKSLREGYSFPTKSLKECILFGLEKRWLVLIQRLASDALGRRHDVDIPRPRIDIQYFVQGTSIVITLYCHPSLMRGNRYIKLQPHEQFCSSATKEDIELYLGVRKFMDRRIRFEQRV